MSFAESSAATRCSKFERVWSAYHWLPVIIDDGREAFQSEDIESRRGSALSLTTGLAVGNKSFTKLHPARNRIPAFPASGSNMFVRGHERPSAPPRKFTRNRRMSHSAEHSRRTNLPRNSKSLRSAFSAKQAGWPASRHSSLCGPAAPLAGRRRRLLEGVHNRQRRRPVESR